MSDQHDSNVTERAASTLRRRPATSVLLDVPASLQHRTGFTSIPSNTQGRPRPADARRTSRPTAPSTRRPAASTSSSSACRLDRLGNNVLSGESRNRVVTHLLEHAAATGVPGQRGTYGYYEVRSNGVDPTQGLHHRRQHPHDEHRPVRPGRVDDQQQADDQRRPAHRARAGADLHDGRRTFPEFGIEFSFGDKLAPRAGFAYDIKGDGKWKAFGSWGVFYDIFKLELPRGSFGGDKWLVVLLHARHLRLAERCSTTRRCPPACPGTLHPRPDRLPSSVVRLGLDRAGPEADAAAGSDRSASITS